MDMEKIISENQTEEAQIMAVAACLSMGRISSIDHNLGYAAACIVLKSHVIPLMGIMMQKKEIDAMEQKIRMATMLQIGKTR